MLRDLSRGGSALPHMRTCVRASVRVWCVRACLRVCLAASFARSAPCTCPRSASGSSAPAWPTSARNGTACRGCPRRRRSSRRSARAHRRPVHRRPARRPGAPPPPPPRRAARAARARAARRTRAAPPGVFCTPPLWAWGGRRSVFLILPCAIPRALVVVGPWLPRPCAVGETEDGGSLISQPSLGCLSILVGW